MPHDLVFSEVDKTQTDNHSRTQPVFTGLNLTVPEGEHLAVIGGSGVGKTTLLRLANRLDEPDAGCIWFGGQPLHELNVTEHRAAVNLVLQKPCLLATTVLDEATYADLLQDRPPDIERGRELLGLVGIEPALHDRAGPTLSVGQQQRVCLARALYCRPKVLMLDETTSSLDPQLALQVINNLITLCADTKMTLLHVTHEMPKIRLADRVILLEGGRVAESATPARFLERPATEAGRRFLGM